LSLLKNSLPVFFASKNKVSKKQAYYFGAFLSSWNIKHESWISSNVGKQEISFPLLVFKKSKNHSRKIILAFQHYQTRPQSIFFEWIPGPEVSGEKKRCCDCCPHLENLFWLLCFLQKVNSHKSHKWFSGHYSLVAGTAGSSHYF
jgi:hypothetical protein